MKKTLILISVLALVACGKSVKYQESGLLCEDAVHNSRNAQITLDVVVNGETADVVVNGENIKLMADTERGSNSVSYYGTNSNNENVKLMIVLSDKGKEVDYMLGINSQEHTYGCFKK